jgi:hypothetical protein
MNQLPARALLLAATLLLPGLAQADEGEAKLEPAAAEARAVLVEYLNAVKAKKWPNARKLTHPKTLETIAQRKKNIGDENHPMAPWFLEKTISYLKDYQVVSAEKAPGGAWIFEAVEDQFQIEEKGIAEAEPTVYLVGRHGGKWLITDKKRGAKFTPAALKHGYKGFFDAEKKSSDDEE